MAENRTLSGIYEMVVTDALSESLLDLDERLDAQRHTLRSAEAADRIALHLSQVIERAIATLEEKDRAQAGAEVARQLIRRLDERPVSVTPCLRLRGNSRGAR